MRQSDENRRKPTKSDQNRREATLNGSERIGSWEWHEKRLAGGPGWGIPGKFGKSTKGDGSRDGARYRGEAMGETDHVIPPDQGFAQDIIPNILLNFHRNPRAGCYRGSEAEVGGCKLAGCGLLPAEESVG